MLDEARTAVFSMSMDSEKKKEMEDFFENLGLTLTSGVNIFFEASVIWAKMPFEVSREETEIPDMTGEEQPAGRARKEARFSMRMQPTRKRQVEYLYKELGMTLSQAVNIYFEACLREYGIPFRIGYPKPNAETLAALKDDDLETYASFDDYLAAMHGTIVDIDYWNHIMFNTVDGTMTAYNSPMLGSVKAYPDIGALIHAHCPELEDRYLALGNGKMLTIAKEFSNHNGSYEKIDIKNSPYALSRRVNALQRLFDKRILRDWNPALEIFLLDK